MFFLKNADIWKLVSQRAFRFLGGTPEVEIVDKVDYLRLAIPSGYRCDTCSATKCKLWRLYMSRNPIVLCGRCVMRRQGFKGELDQDGLRVNDIGKKTDQVGPYVPAVPHKDISGEWCEYGGMPDAPYNWWRRLPTYPTRVASA